MQGCVQQEEATAGWGFAGISPFPAGPGLGARRDLVVSPPRCPGQHRCFLCCFISFQGTIYYFFFPSLGVLTAKSLPLVKSPLLSSSPPSPSCAVSWEFSPAGSRERGLCRARAGAAPRCGQGWGRALGCLCSALGAGLGAGGGFPGLQEPSWGLETSLLAFWGGFAALHGAGVLPALPSVVQWCCCLCMKAKLAQTGFPAHKSTPQPLGYGLASPGGGRGPREPGRGRHEAPGPPATRLLPHRPRLALRQL